MRIALVTTSWPSTDDDADGHFVRTHARALEREGHAVTVITPRKGGAFGAPGVAARVRERPARALDAAAWVVQARARIASLRPERVVAHWCVPCGVPIATAGSAPIEIVSHGGDVRLVLGLPAVARRQVVRALAARAAAWTFVSQALLASLLLRLDAETRALVERVARVEAAPIEWPDVRSAIARRRAELGDARIAVCVARLVPSKRVDRVIAHAARSADVDVLVVVGDGPERAPLERLARAHRVQARFVGAVGRREALAWIGSANVLLHASEAEGLSTVVREAEALGTPVVRVAAA